MPSLLTKAASPGVGQTAGSFSRLRPECLRSGRCMALLVQAIGSTKSASANGRGRRIACGAGDGAVRGSTGGSTQRGGWIHGLERTGALRRGGLGCLGRGTSGSVGGRVSDEVSSASAAQKFGLANEVGRGGEGPREGFVPACCFRRRPLGFPKGMSRVGAV